MPLSLLILSTGCVGSRTDSEKLPPERTKPAAKEERFCNAADGLGVGEPSLQPGDRLQILKVMRANSPDQWHPVIEAAARSVKIGEDMPPRWAEAINELGAYIESTCSLNMPAFTGE